jgi:hypothetical protein
VYTTITPPAARRRRLTSLLLVSLVCLAGAAFGLAQSASAAVPGINLAAARSPFNSANKSATVACPAGDQVLGVGGGIDPATGPVVVDDWMQIGLTRGAVRGVEAAPFAPSWVAGATAICADPLPGRVQVIATSASSSTDKFVTATCPAGKRLVATGSDVLGGKGNVMIERVVPDLPTNSVTVLGHEHNPTTDSWSDRASAVCADPIPGLVRVFATSPASSANKSVSVSCPAGTVLTGTGAETLSSGGRAAVDSVEPNVYLTGVTVRAAEILPTNLNWTTTAFAVCAAA